MKYPVGTKFEGVVDKKESFGIFITILPGITGLLPKSKWRDVVESKPYEHAKRGDVLKVQVDEIKFEERKISLGIPAEGEDDSWREHQTSAPKGLGALAAAFSKAKRT
jgi:small subunit ribosomal protein S1